jgi:CBS domain-containing protein
MKVSMRQSPPAQNASQLARRQAAQNGGALATTVKVTVFRPSALRRPIAASWRYTPTNGACGEMGPSRWYGPCNDVGTRRNTMQLDEYRVSDLMTTALITVTPDQNVGAADLEMKTARIRHLPVVDKWRHLVGILSDRDLLAALANRRRTTICVRDVMTTAVRTIDADAPVKQAAEWMLAEKIGALPVEGEDGQLVGLITETDLLRLFLSESEKSEPGLFEED